MPKSRILHLAGRGQVDVLRLEVTVDDATSVETGECRTDLQRDRERLFRGKRTASLQHGSERRPSTNSIAI